MKKRGYSILIILVSLFGYFYLFLWQGYSLKADKVIQANVEEIEKYESMKNALIGNLDYIIPKYSNRNVSQKCEKKLLFSRGNRTAWLGWERDHPELNKIGKGYGEDLFYYINIYENKAVYFKSIFRGRKIMGDFLHHHIVYEPDENELNKKYLQCEYEIKKKDKIMENWYYIIVQIN